jgi:hypothetical protein
MNSELIGLFDIINLQNGDLISYARDHGIKSIRIELNINVAYSTCIMQVNKTNWSIK